MLLTHRFAAPEVNLALELFLRMIGDFFGERLVSVVLYGSIVFDDLAPGYGDLDFLAVVEDDLSPRDCQQLVDLRRPLRSGDFGILCQMIEGAFLPRRLLDPEVKGSALWWGTTGEGKLSSKSEAADWGHIHAKGAWRQYLLPAKKIRRNPSLVYSSKWKTWLRTIGKPTYEAWEEVRNELLKVGFKP